MTDKKLDEILTDERLARMRTSVMDEVDKDVRTRRRRRTALSVAAAAAVVVVAVGGGVVVGTQLDSGTTASGLTREATPNVGAVAPTRTITPDDSGRAAVGSQSLRAPQNPTNPAAPEEGRQVVSTGTVAVTANDPAGVAQELVTYAATVGGRVDERREWGSEGEKDSTRSATVTLRVPNAKVDDAVAKIRTLGDATSVSLQHEDVTGTVVDLDARIRATQLSVDRLSDILSRADTSDKVIQAEEALTSRQQQLESLQSRRAAIGERVELSTITVTVTSPEAKSDRGGLLGGLADGWDALLGAGRWLLIAVGAVLPWLALLLVLYGAYRVVRRARSRA